MTLGYTAYVLEPSQRKTLLEIFEAQFDIVKADHITVAFNVSANTPIPALESVEVTHHITDERGLECLVLRVNGEDYRDDGKRFHITWSLTSEHDDNLPNYITQNDASAFRYRPLHSNFLIATALNDDTCPDHVTVRELNCKLPANSFKPKFIA